MSKNEKRVALLGAVCFAIEAATLILCAPAHAHADTATEMAIITANQGTTPAAAVDNSVSGQVHFLEAAQWPAGYQPLRWNGVVYVTADGSKFASPGSTVWKPAFRLDRVCFGDHCEMRRVSTIPGVPIVSSPASLPTTVGPVQRRGVFGWRK